MNFTIYILSSLIVFISLTGLIKPSLNRISNFLLLAYIIFISFFISPYLGQKTTYILLIGCIIIIAMTSKPVFYNITLSLFGYLTLVTINNAILGIVSPLLPQKVLALPINTIIFSILFLFLSLLITHGLRTFLLNKVKLLDLNIPDITFLLFFVEEIFCAGFFILNFSYNEKMQYPSYIVVTNAILFTCFFLLTVAISFVIIYYIKKDYASRQKLKEYEQLQNYIYELESLYSEMRIYRHDNINLLSSIYGYIDENDMPGLKSYFQNKILNEINKPAFSHIEIGKLSEIKILEIKGLLYAKLLHAFSKHLNVTVSIDCPVISTRMESTDLIKILGIFLDNAIEAAEFSMSKQLDISFSKTSDFTVLSVGNSCDLETIPLIQLSEPNYTTKGPGHGIGLATVKQLLQKYPDIHHHTQFKDHYFVQQLNNI